MSEALQQLDSLTPDQRALVFEKLRARRQQNNLNSVVISTPIAPADRTKPIPLTFVQEQLWFLQQVNPNTCVYNAPLALRLNGPLNIGQLETAIELLVQRHEILRTIFVMADVMATSASGNAVQVIQPPTALPTGNKLVYRDLTASGTTDVCDYNIEQALDAVIYQPFDLAQQPPWRIHLFRDEPARHILLVVFHHILADGWSLGLFFTELADLYNRLSNTLSSMTVPLPPVPIHYADYAVWQRASLQGDEWERQLNYWRQHLQGAPTLLPLATDHPRPALLTHHGATCPFLISATQTQQIKNLSTQSGSTLFMTLLAVWQILLFRYTGQEEIVIGSTIANRTHHQLANMLGYFANTIALRTQLTPQATFLQLLQQVRQVMQGAYEHQEFPFEKLVQDLQPERDPSYHPLFQVMFTLHNMPVPDTLKFGDCTVSLWPVSLKTAKFDLSLTLAETVGGLQGFIEYNADLFEAATIERMVGHFQTLLIGIVAQPNCCLSDLPLLNEAERQQLLVEWNETQADYPKTKCIHQLFQEQVERTPDALAVVMAGGQRLPKRQAPDSGVPLRPQSLTYGELNARSNQLARYLQNLGVGSSLGTETLVGICVERSVEMVVGLLAILKAGGAYLPLDPTYPPERLAFMLQDADITVLLTQEQLLTQLPMTTAQVICLDRDWAQIAIQSSSTSLSNIKAAHLAYVIYTSGSTGQPKGVMITHGSLTNFLWAMRTKPGFTADDTLLAVTTLAFDIAGLELYLPLITGGKLVLVDQATTRDGVALAAALMDSGATVMQATPATWRLLLSAGWQGLATLKLLCGGEALPRPLAEQLLHCGRELWNLYGPTETTIWSTFAPIHTADKPVTIGGGPTGTVANTQLYVLDTTLKPVPIGVSGELYIGGEGLSRGYLNRPTLTAERFMMNPWGTGKLYRTGDLVRWLPDGNIEYLGRIDQQVKLRGFRIELGEIESVLRQHPAVREAVVIAREDTPGEKRLVAYVVPAKRTEWQASALSLPKDDKDHVAEDITLSPPHIVPLSALRSHLQAKLPDYMLPSAFVELERLPLTPNGKLDRNALPAPDFKTLGGEQTYIAPHTATETQLADIWRALLGIEQVGIQDSFFECGGHSLLTVQLMQRIQADFAIALPLQRILAEPTIAALAAQIDALQMEAVRATPEIAASGAPTASSSPMAHQAALTCLVPLRTSGTRLPFFCVHPLAGVVFPYYELAYRLGVEQPVYGLQAVGLADKEIPLQSLQAMAAHYLSALQAVQPAGPYYLGGWSLGGLIAYEMAQQLEAAGETVACLAIMDTPAPSVQLTNPLSAILHLGVKTLLPALSAYCIDYLRLWRQQQAGLPLPALHRLLRVTLANTRASRQVRLQPYSGRVTLLRSAQDFGALGQHPDLGWGAFARGGVEVVSVPGDHMTLLRQPHVPIVAERLRACLVKAGQPSLSNNVVKTKEHA